MSFRECNPGDTGLSWEWRAGGAPTTDEDLHDLLAKKELSVVVFGEVACRLQKKISK
jgi:hypothetical protein